MNPGKLNRRIVIQVRTLTADDMGGRVMTWADHATVSAEQVVQRGQESPVADADRTQDNRQFRIRWRAIASDTHRILYQSKFFDIRNISEEGVKTTLLLDTVATQSIS